MSGNWQQQLVDEVKREVSKDLPSLPGREDIEQMVRVAVKSQLHTRPLLRLYSPRTVAEAFDVDVSTVWRWEKAGKMPFNDGHLPFPKVSKRFGDRCSRFDAAEIDSLLDTILSSEVANG